MYVCGGALILCALTINLNWSSEGHFLCCSAPDPLPPLLVVVVVLLLLLLLLRRFLLMLLCTASRHSGWLPSWPRYQHRLAVLLILRMSRQLSEARTAVLLHASCKGPSRSSQLCLGIVRACICHASLGNERCQTQAQPVLLSLRFGQAHTLRQHLCVN